MVVAMLLPEDIPCSQPSEAFGKIRQHYRALFKVWVAANVLAGEASPGMSCILAFGRLAPPGDTGANPLTTTFKPWTITTRPWASTSQ